jgi:serine protease Do
MKAVCLAVVALALTGTLALLAGEKSDRGFLGVSVQSLDENEREKLGVTHGVQVVRVEKESAAAKAGILQDDVIQSVNGEKVRDPRSLSEVVRELPPGSTARIGLRRNGKAQEVKAVLGKIERPKRFDWKVAPFSKVIRSRAYLGVNLLELDVDLAAYFSVKAGEGVLISGVGKDTPAAKAGLKSGDVLVQMADKPVGDSGDIHEILAGLKKGDSIALTIIRHGQRETLKAEPDFNRHNRIIRMFTGDNDKDIEIDHLELPEFDIAIPEIDFAAPGPPDPPHTDEILRRVHEKLDKAKIKVDLHLQKIKENCWI